MADKYIVISNFKYGLDTRRSELSTVPGTLAVCQNGFINAGGEVEKRKAFVKAATNFPPSTYGLQDTSSGLMTFGGRAYPNSEPISAVARANNVATITTVYVHTINVGDTITVIGLTDTTFNTASAVVTAIGETTLSYANTGDPNAGTADSGTVYEALPAGVVYQQLEHPYNDPAVLQFDMTSVVYSCSFRGLPFVIASYEDGTKFCFYNGTLVESSRTGVVLKTDDVTPESLTQLATNLATTINAEEGWVADANVAETAVADEGGLHETSSTGSVLIMTPPGVHASVTTGEDSESGQIGAQLVDQNWEGIAGRGAHATFTVNAGSGGDTFTVTAPATSAGTGTYTLASAVAWVTSHAATAEAIVTAINRNTYLTNYVAKLASPGSATVVVFAPTLWGALPNAWGAGGYYLVVTATGSGGSTGGTYESDKITIVLNPANVYKYKATTVRGQVAVWVKVTASILGGAVGTLPTFTWEECLANGDAMPDAQASGITAQFSGTGATCTFILRHDTSPYTRQYFYRTTHFKCHATLGSLTDDLIFRVTLIIDYASNG